MTASWEGSCSWDCPFLGDRNRSILCNSCLLLTDILRFLDLVAEFQLKALLVWHTS